MLREQAERRQHWAALLDIVDFENMIAADKDGLRQQLKNEPDAEQHMFTTLLTKQLQ